MKRDEWHRRRDVLEGIESVKQIGMGRRDGRNCGVTDGYTILS